MLSTSRFILVKCMEGVWTMKKLKQVLSHIFIDGLSGMALGLFATLIVGTILEQIGKYVSYANAEIGTYILLAAAAAKAVTGAGIGVGVAVKFKQSPLVTVSAAVCGMVGAFASKLIAGSVVTSAGVLLAGPGEPLGAFVAALAGIEVGRLVSGRTKLDIIVTPVVTIAVGSVVGFLLGPPVSAMMTSLGDFIKWGTEQQPFLMGIIVSVVMGMVLTLPISSAALGISLNLTGIAAGAAAVGCSAQMIGFAVQSFRENKVSGLISQGVGTSMIQMPNIVRKPVVWLPPIITSAILGPIASCGFRMVNTAVGSGMGTSGLVGPISGFEAMTAAGLEPVWALAQIALMYFIAPAVLTLIISEIFRKAGLIKDGDLKLAL